jgi:hypothetical protein
VRESGCAQRDASGDRRGSGGCDELDVGGRKTGRKKGRKKTTQLVLRAEMAISELRPAAVPTLFSDLSAIPLPVSDVDAAFLVIRLSSRIGRDPRRVVR